MKDKGRNEPIDLTSHQRGKRIKELCMSRTGSDGEINVQTKDP